MRQGVAFFTNINVEINYRSLSAVQAWMNLSVNNDYFSFFKKILLSLNKSEALLVSSWLIKQVSLRIMLLYILALFFIKEKQKNGMCVCFASPVLLQMCNDSEDILFYFFILCAAKDNNVIIFIWFL